MENTPEANLKSCDRVNPFCTFRRVLGDNTMGNLVASLTI
jgi:hypothetical protein